MELAGGADAGDAGGGVMLGAGTPPPVPLLRAVRTITTSFSSAGWRCGHGSTPRSGAAGAVYPCWANGGSREANGGVCVEIRSSNQSSAMAVAAVIDGAGEEERTEGGRGTFAAWRGA